MLTAQFCQNGTDDGNAERNARKTDTNRKAYQEDTKSDQAKMIAAFKEKMDAMIANIKNDREETTACHDEMEARIKKTEPNLV
jgi:hypothetical protein